MADTASDLFGINITGNIEAQLRRFSDASRQNIREALAGMARDLVSDVRLEAPVGKTGGIKKSIGWKRVNDAGLLGETIGANVGARAFYSIMQDKGYGPTRAKIRAYSRRIAMVFGHPVGVESIDVKAHKRITTQKANPFFTANFDAAKAGFADRLTRAITSAAQVTR
jgi:hypothetical protein